MMDFLRRVLGRSSNNSTNRPISPAPIKKQPSQTPGVKANIPEKVLPAAPTTAPEKSKEPAKESVKEPLTGGMNMDKSKFYDHLRSTLLRSGVRDNHVLAMDELIKDMDGRPASWIAYAMATAWHETGGKMTPNTETLNYNVQGLLNTFGRHRISEADARRLGRKQGEGPLSVARQREIGNLLYGGDWGRRNLGNTEPNDGWTFRGRGMDHCTGRRNYKVTGDDIGVDLIANPEALLVLANAIKALHTGMVSGRYAGDRTGRHNFARHLPASGSATHEQFVAARRIINGVDKADQIARHAIIFQAALNTAGYRK
jgi:putative chitinase